MIDYLLNGFNDEMEKVALFKEIKELKKYLKSIPKQVDETKKAFSKLSDEAKNTSRIIGAGVIGGLGIYGGSKLLSIPEAVQRYGYYKNKKLLAEEQLKEMRAKKW